ncbi:hypothetical protein ACEQUB_p01410 (plasmid) [Ralstonia syzygii]
MWDASRKRPTDRYGGRVSLVAAACCCWPPGSQPQPRRPIAHATDPKAMALRSLCGRAGAGGCSVTFVAQRILTMSLSGQYNTEPGICKPSGRFVLLDRPGQAQRAHQPGDAFGERRHQLGGRAMLEDGRRRAPDRSFRMAGCIDGDDVDLRPLTPPASLTRRRYSSAASAVARVEMAIEPSNGSTCATVMTSACAVRIESTATMAASIERLSMIAVTRKKAGLSSRQKECTFRRQGVICGTAMLGFSAAAVCVVGCYGAAPRVPAAEAASDLRRVPVAPGKRWLQ